MSALIDFVHYIILSFSGFLDWFFNTEIVIGSWTGHPYMIFGFSCLVVIIGLLIVNLINPFG